MFLVVLADAIPHIFTFFLTLLLFIKRVNYVRILARRVVEPDTYTYRAIDALVEHVLLYGRLPAAVTYRGRRYRVESLVNQVLSTL